MEASGFGALKGMNCCDLHMLLHIDMWVSAERTMFGCSYLSLGGTGCRVIGK
jgi:hypothetical protein